MSTQPISKRIYTALGMSLFCTLLSLAVGCQNDTLLLITINGPQLQTMQATLTMNGKAVGPVQQLRGDEVKFALALPMGQSGSGEILVEGFQGNDCVAARGRIPVKVADGEHAEVAVAVVPLAAHECPVDAAMLNRLYGFSDKDIWAIGSLNTILRWDGVRWNRIDTGQPGFVTSVWGKPNELLVSGSNMLSYDGKTFTKMDKSTNFGLYAVGGGTGAVWASGDHGAIIRYQNEIWTDKDDAGMLWSPYSQTDTVQNVLWEIALTEDGTQWIVGDNGNMLRWDPKTSHWQQVDVKTRMNSKTQDRLFRISVKGSDAWLISVNGNLWRLVKGTWVPQLVSLATPLLLAVYAQDSQTVWLAGKGGFLVKCTPAEDKMSVKCIDRHFTQSVDMTAIWGSGQDDLWIAGGVSTGDGMTRENSTGYMYHLVP